MAWFVYDYDSEGHAVQRGPFSRERADYILGKCHSSKAEKIEWPTISRPTARAWFKEERTEKEGLDKGMMKFKNAEVFERQISKLPSPIISNSNTTGKVVKPDVKGSVDSIIRSVRDRVESLKIKRS
jgi:hypothetical protein